MADIIAIVDQNYLTASVGYDTGPYVSTNLSNPAILGSISDIGNVDTSIIQNGSVLVFNSITNKWTSTIHLDLQDMEAGEF
jgi:hypothetical protein